VVDLGKTTNGFAPKKKPSRPAIPAPAIAKVIRKFWIKNLLFPRFEAI
jgi:hypothetical protein